MTTPDTEWEKELKNQVVGMLHPEIYKRTVSFINSLLTSRDTYWKEGVNKDNLMGMIVKNSTGFDTIGNQRLWHLDIDAFEADLDTLLDNLK